MSDSELEPEFEFSKEPQFPRGRSRIPDPQSSEEDDDYESEEYDDALDDLEEDLEEDLVEDGEGLEEEEEKLVPIRRQRPVATGAAPILQDRPVPVEMMEQVVVKDTDGGRFRSPLMMKRPEVRMQVAESENLDLELDSEEPLQLFDLRNEITNRVYQYLGTRANSVLLGRMLFDHLYYGVSYEDNVMTLIQEIMTAIA